MNIWQANQLQTPTGSTTRTGNSISSDQIYNLPLMASKARDAKNAVGEACDTPSSMNPCLWPWHSSPHSHGTLCTLSAQVPVLTTPLPAQRDPDPPAADITANKKREDPTPTGLPPCPDGDSWEETPSYSTSANPLERLMGAGWCERRCCWLTEAQFSHPTVRGTLIHCFVNLGFSYPWLPVANLSPVANHGLQMLHGNFWKWTIPKLYQAFVTVCCFNYSILTTLLVIVVNLFLYPIWV